MAYEGFLNRRGRVTPFCDRHARKDRWYRHSYGISQRQVDAMAIEQGHACAICRAETELHVDHDHDTGVVRGLLCGSCNRAIGLLAHDRERLARAAAYLSEKVR